MGVPQFYTWLINRYPLVRSQYNPSTLPFIDWLLIDLNGIVCKFVQDESLVLKDILEEKKFEDIVVQVFNCLNEIIQLVHPQKTLMLAFDGVMPQARMSQERVKRFKYAKRRQKLDNLLASCGNLERKEIFDINCISPGTEFMNELNHQIKFFIQRKMKEDERWRKLSVIFSGADVPGESEYKIFEFIRRKCQETSFNPNTTICIFGNDPNLLMLGLVPHLPFICILHEHAQPQNQQWLANKQYQQSTFYDFEWINVLRDYLEIEFSPLKEKMGGRYNLDKIIDDFVFLNLFLCNRFLPRVFCMNVKIENIDRILEVFKEYLEQCDGYINNKGVIDWVRAIFLFQKLAQLEVKFIGDKLEEQVAHASLAKDYKKNLDEVDTFDIQSNQETIQEVNELTEDYEEYEKSVQEELSVGSESDEDGPPLSVTKRKIGFSTPRKSFHIRPGGKRSVRTQGDIYKEDLDLKELDQSNSSDSTSKSDNENPIRNLHRVGGDHGKEEDKQYNEQSLKNYRSDYSDSYINEMVREYKDRNAQESNYNFAEYSNGETFSRLLSADVIENDSKFLASLLKLYTKNKVEASKFYYKEKFGISNIQENPEELKAIIYSYAQGLQFVLSYYYVHCPSWKWVYNYHYSPLLLDLMSLADSTDFLKSVGALRVFERSKPAEPYKQLWYTLPLQQMHLIPKPLANIICDPEAVLYKYHSLEFAVDPFGGILYYEYIGKVPFIIDEVLEAEYQKAMKNCNFSGKEEARNRHGMNLVYEWNSAGQEVEVDSPQPSYFEKVRVKVKISQFNFDDLPFDINRILDRPLHGTYRYHKSFPSINFIQDKRIEYKAFNLKIGTADRCCIRLGQRLNLTEYKQYRKLLDQPFYCMYPFLVPCFVMGVVTPDQLITNVDYKNLPFSYLKSQHRTYYTNLSLNVHQFYFIHMGILFKESMINFALVYLESEPRKDSLGMIYSPKPRVEAIPLNFLIDTKIMPSYRGRIDYSQKDLTKEFPLYTDAIINVGPPTGSLAKIVGYVSEAADFDNVDVKIVKTVPKLNHITSAIANKYDDHRRYRSVYKVAKHLGVDLQVILRVLDCLFIKIENTKNGQSIYPERLDLGLNLIRRRYHSILPELIICNDLKNYQKAKSRTFPHFQLSPEAIELVSEYYKIAKPVFDALTKKTRSKDPSPLTASNIFGNVEDPDLEVFKIYIWILKQESSSLSMNNKASKVIPREGIKELEKVLTGGKSYFGEQAKHILNKVFPYNPNFLIPKYLDNWIPPFFTRKPLWHKLGDRIVNLKVNGYSFAPFGAVGTVVGILGNRQENGVLKARIEVVFDSAFIGGENLGGRCSWGRGAVVNFDDIFNLNSWGKCIGGRDPKRTTINQDWDGNFPNSYLPSFQTASEVSETDDEESIKPSHLIAPAKPVLQEDLIDMLAKKKKPNVEVLKVQSKHQPKNWNKNKFQNQSQNQNRGNYNPKVANVVPKTLGLIKQAHPNLNPNPNLQAQAQGQILYKTLKIPEPTPVLDVQNKAVDLSSIIENNIPKLPNEAMSNRFSRSGTMTMETGPDDSAPKISSIYEESPSMRKEVGLSNRERFQLEESPSSMGQNEVMTDEFSRRVQRRSVTEPIVGLGQRFRKTSDKDVKKTGSRDLDESSRNQIKIEVSQGGHIVTRRTVDIIYSENEGGN